MRRLIPALALLCLALAPRFVHSQDRRCGSVEYMNRLKAADPGAEQRLRDNEESIRRFIESHASSRTTTTIYTIPVVFHVLWRTTAQNISAARINDQLAVLNADYARLNADTGNTPSSFHPVSAGSNIRFCLATRDPNGAATTGILYKQVSVNGFDPLSNDNVKFSNLGGDDAWPRGDYLNVWVCNFNGASNGLLGISQMPGMAASTDGCCVLYSTVGGPLHPGTYAPFNHGRTLTHEVGHWFALYHIWGDDNGACTGTDYVNDTPNQAGENYGCPTFPTLDACATSSPGAMFMNYMDYVDDDCMNAFTSGQVSRMHSALSVLRSSLMSSQGCMAPVGLNDPSASSSFTVFPNPSAGSLKAAATFSAPSDIRLRVQNAMGQLVLQRDMKNVSVLDLDLDLSGQAPGVYFVTLETGSSLESRRLILAENRSR